MDIIVPLSRAWKLKKVRAATEEYFVVLKPEVSLLFRMVASAPTFLTFNYPDIPFVV
jgi:hypothetical protein